MQATHPHDPTPTGTAALRAAIRDQALAIGFDAVGFAPAKGGMQAGERLAAFLAAGHHGDMGWMAETAARRADPTAMWPEARTAIVLAQNYGPAGDPLAVLEHPAHAGISVYARTGRDYHDVVKGRLKQLAGWVASRGQGAAVKVFVDTAPLMEKPLAARAGLGWQGKHTNLVSRAFGSWLFLGSILTTLDLTPDEPAADHCGQCRRCLDACPTDAFPAAYQLDARRCISYLTIEHAGPIPREFRAAMGNRVYGCDDCLAVCPWNKFARTARTAGLAPRVELTAPRLSDLAALDDAAFRAVFSASPIKRIGRDRFVRNVLIAIGNSDVPALVPAAERLLDDPSPLVRGAAVWALSRLLDAEAFSGLRERWITAEADSTVREEWAAAQAATSS